MFGHPARAVTFGFLIAVSLGTAMLWLPVSVSPAGGSSFRVALFTATSAISVTGLAVVDTAGHWSTFGEVESTKSVSDVYAPVSGRVVEVNDELADAPQRLNEDPYGAGWICVIELSDASELERLLDAGAYRTLLEG